MNNDNTFHLSHNCSRINSRIIVFGAIEQETGAGKASVCIYCAENAEHD